MKRFLLFTFDLYGGGGGAKDFAGSFDSFTEAKTEAEMQLAKSLAGDYNIIDTVTGNGTPLTDHHATICADADPCPACGPKKTGPKDFLVQFLKLVHDLDFDYVTDGADKLEFLSAVESIERSLSDYVEVSI